MGIGPGRLAGWWRRAPLAPEPALAAPPPSTGHPAVVDEHFVPEAGLDLEAALARGDQVAAHHLLRYAWLARVLADGPEPLRLLDAGCGDGYGASLLALRHPASSVVALDHDPAAIAAAAARYAASNLRFVAGRLERLAHAVGEERFDVVVLFDVLEHVAHRELALESLVRSLAPEGRLFLSTPCGHAEDDLRPAWPAHRIEYAPGSLYAFLRRYFEVIRRPDDGSLPHVSLFDEARARGVDYLLRLNPVICSRPIAVETPYGGGR